jgi:hypothetical protein
MKVRSFDLLRLTIRGNHQSLLRIAGLSIPEIIIDPQKPREIKRNTGSDLIINKKDVVRPIGKKTVSQESKAE